MQYTHGYHKSVFSSHSWRTVKNSCPHLIPYLKPNLSVLDIGCGPGTITIDMAKNYVPEGIVTALEYDETPLNVCKENAEKDGVTNIVYKVGDIHNLPFEDNTFDVVHAHQVLQHISDPTKAMAEMLRVTKPRGYVSCRESNFCGFSWYPESPGMTKWLENYIKVAQSNGGDPNIGKCLQKHAVEAGYTREKLILTSSSWCYATKEEVDWWGQLWADRTLHSNFASSALSKNILSQSELNSMSNAWLDWKADPNAYFVCPHGELIYQK
ncbi:hypothetical protein TRVA0_002S04060 [Trichomonascus vanleenenianus]|uniref:class I SAM-dependent methyltransferase n=1 Tax=Trichomonascus vanleenenianus TaxID=2268995 RepID=UPI003ECA4EF7